MTYLSALSIDDLVLGISDLLAEDARPDRPNRSAALTRVDGDKIYRSDLASVLAGLAALPPEQRGIPLRELVRSSDGAFDRDGQILRLYQQILALLTAPIPAVASAAASIDTIAPAGITRASYSTEAAHAKRIEPTLATHRPVLAAIALPDTDTPDLGAVAARLVASGLELDRLGSQRGGTVAARGDRAGAAPLRARAIGTLNALRDHVGRALGSRPDLPRDLEGQIFGYLDELERRAEGRSTGNEPTVNPAPPAPNPQP